ncbi:MAG: hypothetical protein NPINA01_18460 [Nitrospinaceae bacterium]|nr:MAG: hypothetical protein NPINA01_18460 [Nitrospinaceae bacterium]
MNPSLRKLHALIEKKIALYDQFILLLQEQWVSISEYSLDSLQVIIAQKEKLVGQMQTLEKERSALMATMEGHLGAAPGALTLKQIIQTTSDPIRTQLVKGREALLSRITAINELHERLKGLMDHSSLSLKKSLAFVHSKGEEASSPYHPNGKLEEGNMQGRMLSLDV